MRPRAQRLNYAALARLILLAVVFLGWLVFRQTITGSLRWDGIIGVLLGLFICAHPAANAIDLLFFHKYMAIDALASRGQLVAWLAMNLLVMGIGWLVIFDGMLRISQGS
jgi:hypothetical protein